MNSQLFAVLRQIYNLPKLWQNIIRRVYYAFRMLKFIVSIFVTTALTLSLLLGSSYFLSFFKALTFADSTSSVIYDDALSSGWSNWSWSTNINFDNPGPLFSGTRSLAFTPSPWGAVYLHTDNPVDTSS